MRTATLLAASLLLSAPLVLVAPAATAFGWCVDHVPGRECWSHTACVGMSRNYATHTERCQYGVPEGCDLVCIRDPCDWLLYCGPGPVLA